MTTRHRANLAIGTGAGSIQTRPEPRPALPALSARATSESTRTLTALMGDDMIVRTCEAAAMLGVAVSTLEAWRSVGEGPPPVVINSRARGYRIGALRAWVRQRERGG
jgi:hypothetical protein